MAKLMIIAELPEPYGNPGHCVVGDGEEYFGFRFDPSDLPPEFRPVERWRRFFVSNTVLGFIADETSFVDQLRVESHRIYHEKQAEAETTILDVIPDANAWEGFALHSFNPFRFRDKSLPCHNCVTWAIDTANSVLPGFLQPVPDGRIAKLIVQLRSPSEESDS